MESYYTAIRRNKVLIHATSCVSLVNIMLSEQATKEQIHDSIHMKYLEWIGNNFAFYF